MVADTKPSLDQPLRRTKTPRLSVCIPVYNGLPFLREAIASILAQDFSDFELILLDDCSDQAIGDAAAEFSDPRIIYRRNTRNLGLVGNWNHCLSLAQGEYITVFHQDDVMLAGNLSAKVALLDERPKVGMVHSGVRRINSEGVVIGGHWAEYCPKVDEILEGASFFARMAVRGNFVSCPSVMARSACYRALGGFDSRLPFTCDMEMWMRIARCYDIAYLASPLIANRVHESQETGRFTGKGREIQEVRRALEIAFANCAPVAVSRDIKRAAFRHLASWAYHMGRWKMGSRKWRAALGYWFAGGEALLKAVIA